MSTAKSNETTVAAPTLSWDWARTLLIVLAIGGLFVAGYMAWAELTGNETVCSDTGKIDCAAVQQSAYAKTIGFPVAVMGLLGYVAMLAVVVLEDQHMLLAAYGRTALIGMALFGFIFQTYLMMIEATVLDAWCQWCVASHIIVTAMLVIGIFRWYGLVKPLRQ